MTEQADSSGAGTAPLLEVGRVGRPHGTGGEVTVTLVSNRPERLAPGSELRTDVGILRVSSARPHSGRHLVAFDGVDDRSQAGALRGLVLRAAPIADPDELWVHELIGARVVDQSGTDRGLVASVVAGPARAHGSRRVRGGRLWRPVRVVYSFGGAATVAVQMRGGPADRSGASGSVVAAGGVGGGVRSGGVSWAGGRA